MKARKLSAVLVSSLLVISLLAGCSRNAEEETVWETTAETTAETLDLAMEETQAPTTAETETEAETAAETTAETTAESAAGTTAAAAETEQKGSLSFSDLSNLEFWFGSGAGGWCTILYIHEDGSFEGSYHDSEMAERSDDYPNGSYYWCNFTGRFTDPVRVDAYTYTVSIDSITLQREPGITEIVDGFQTVSTEPLGLDNAGEFCIYLPGAPIDGLPTGYYDWVAHSSSLTSSDTTLPYYGFYNVNAEEGFSSYERTD